MAQDPREPRYSPDGLWWWDGVAWRPVMRPQPPRPPAGGMPAAAVAGIIAAGVIFVLITTGTLGYVAFTRINKVASSRTSTPAITTRVPCDLLEHTQVHYHAALQIIVNGNPMAIPTGLGRTGYCYYWLHMHTGEPGIIHIEAPADQTFTMGDFFAVWSAWSAVPQRLDARHVSTLSLTQNQKLVVYVDSGSGPRAYAGDPAAIVLEEHEVVTLEVSPPAENPPPAFDWPQGF